MDYATAMALGFKGAAVNADNSDLIIEGASPKTPRIAYREKYEAEITESDFRAISWKLMRWRTPRPHELASDRWVPLKEPDIERLMLEWKERSNAEYADDKVKGG